MSDGYSDDFEDDDDDEDEQWPPRVGGQAGQGATEVDAKAAKARADACLDDDKLDEVTSATRATSAPAHSRRSSA